MELGALIGHTGVELGALIRHTVVELGALIGHTGVELGALIGLLTAENTVKQLTIVLALMKSDPETFVDGDRTTREWSSVNRNYHNMRTMVYCGLNSFNSISVILSSKDNNERT